MVPYRTVLYCTVLSKHTGNETKSQPPSNQNSSKKMEQVSNHQVMVSNIPIENHITVSYIPLQLNTSQHHN